MRKMIIMMWVIISVVATRIKELSVILLVSLFLLFFYPKVFIALTVFGFVVLFFLFMLSSAGDMMERQILGEHGKVCDCNEPERCCKFMEIQKQWETTHWQYSWYYPQ
ncbi:MAG: hypothetical protein V1707_03115 [bacterium]